MLKEYFMPAKVPATEFLAAKILAPALLVAALFASTPAPACSAIAFNPDSQAWGRATGRPDLSDAMNAAADECKTGCGIYAWTCSREVAAVVYDASGNWATSTGPNATAAIANARVICTGKCDGYVTAGDD
jgi:hypothetical protein